jgi:hypothetical protein
MKMYSYLKKVLAQLFEKFFPTQYADGEEWF